MVRFPPAYSMAIGAIFNAAGLAVAATAPILGTDGSKRIQAQQSIGGVGILVGWILLGWGIHRFGRQRGG